MAKAMSEFTTDLHAGMLQIGSEFRPRSWILT